MVAFISHAAYCVQKVIEIPAQCVVASIIVLNCNIWCRLNSKYIGRRIEETEHVLLLEKTPHCNFTLAHQDHIVASMALSHLLSSTEKRNDPVQTHYSSPTILVLRRREPTTSAAHNNTCGGGQLSRVEGYTNRTNLALVRIRQHRLAFWQSTIRGAKMLW